MFQIMFQRERLHFRKVKRCRNRKPIWLHFILWLAYTRHVEWRVGMYRTLFYTNLIVTDINFYDRWVNWFMFTQSCWLLMIVSSFVALLTSMIVAYWGSETQKLLLLLRYSILLRNHNLILSLRFNLTSYSIEIKRYK